MTEDQKAMTELLEEYARSIGMSLVQFLAGYRRPGEPLFELLERVYKMVESAGSAE